MLNIFKRAIGWTIVNNIGTSHDICTHKIQLMPDHKPNIDHQRRLNSPMQEVVKKDIIKWLYSGVIFLIADSSWVCSVQVCSRNRGNDCGPS